MERKLWNVLQVIFQIVWDDGERPASPGREDTCSAAGGDVSGEGAVCHKTEENLNFPNGPKTRLISGNSIWYRRKMLNLDKDLIWMIQAEYGVYVTWRNISVHGNILTTWLLLTCCRTVTPADQPGNVNNNLLRRKKQKNRCGWKQHSVEFFLTFQLFCIFYCIWSVLTC